MFVPDARSHRVEGCPQTPRCERHDTRPPRCRAVCVHFPSRQALACVRLKGCVDRRCQPLTWLGLILLRGPGRGHRFSQREWICKVGPAAVWRDCVPQAIVVGTIYRGLTSVAGLFER